VVCPEVPGVCPEKTMEVLFFAQGTLVSNLDFVESIFATPAILTCHRTTRGWIVEHWIGVSRCVILCAAAVDRADQKQVGLPHYDFATDRQRRDKMCYRTRRKNTTTAFLQAHLPHQGPRDRDRIADTITATARKK